MADPEAATEGGGPNPKQVLPVPPGGERLYYLGVPVVPVCYPEVLLGEWAVCRWPDGKLWRHWAAQLHVTPWGQANG